MMSRFISIIVCIFCSLLVPADLHALNPVGEEREEQEAPLREEIWDAEISEEEAETAEERIKEDIKKMKQERKAIIEKVEKKRPRIKRRPYATETRPKPRKVESVPAIKKEKILLVNRPPIVILILVTISILIYLLYKLMMKRLNS